MSSKEKILETFTNYKPEVKSNGNPKKTKQKEHSVKLQDFIRKYQFAQESVIWEIKDGELRVRFQSNDQNLLGEVVMKEFDLPHNIKSNQRFAIYNTSKLNKLLQVLDGDISIELTKMKVEQETRYPNIKIADQSTTITFVLADPEIIPHVPQIQKMPSFEVEFTVDNDFRAKFIKSHDAFSQSHKSFSVHTEDDGVEVAIGYSKINEDMVVIVPAESRVSKKIRPLNFTSSFFKNILLVNRNLETAKFKISEKGMAHIHFEGDDFLADYYFIALDSMS